MDGLNYRSNGIRVGIALLVMVLCSGCATRTVPFTANDSFGRTYYIDGAGNWGFGVRAIDTVLSEAGYPGHVVSFRWSPTLNPALDQTVGQSFARRAGKRLGEQIQQYQERFPDGEVNIIALSAGTGVAIWACESLKPPARVDKVILLGSSLSCDYDLRPALENITEGLWVYHSPNDMVLRGAARVLGTIDGKVGTDSAGLNGFTGGGSQWSLVRQIAWSPEDEQRGWTGSHLSAVSRPFLQTVVDSTMLSDQPTIELTAVLPVADEQAREDAFVALTRRSQMDE
jgi:hypothetical protein